MLSFRVKIAANVKRSNLKLNISDNDLVTTFLFALNYSSLNEGNLPLMSGRMHHFQL